MLPFCTGGCWQYKTHLPKNIKQVSEKLHSILSEYDEKCWDSNYCNSIQCFSFAHYVFNECFDRGEKRLGEFTKYGDGDKYPMWILDNRACDVYLANQLKTGYSSEDMKKFMQGIKPGDYMQIQWNGYTLYKGMKLFGYHSAIVYEVDMEREYIWFFDANYFPNNKIKKHSMSFKDFYKKIYAVSAYRYWNYVD